MCFRVRACAVTLAGALLDQCAAEADRDRVGAVAGLEAGEDGLRVGADRLGAQAELRAPRVGRVAVGVELQDLALAAGQRAAAARCAAAGSTKLLRSAAASTARASASVGELLAT